MMRHRKRSALGGLVLVLMLFLAACAQGQTVLLVSDMPLDGLDASVSYKLESNPSGTSETNRALLQGMNGESPRAMVTEFEKTSDTTRTQLVEVTLPDGGQANVLSMHHARISFGLTEWLVVSSSTYDMSDANGGRQCGAKVRMDFKPNAVMSLIDGEVGRGWDAIWYYRVPCAAGDTTSQLDLADAQFHALVITEQWVPRITGEPLVFNRGRSVTVVGGQPAALPAGWWLTNSAASAGSSSVLGAAGMVVDLVNNLNTSQRPWLEFDQNGPFRDSSLVYSAADAEAFFTAEKVLLNRETDYVVNVRPNPAVPWRELIVRPIYNAEWNDWAQNWAAFNSFNPLNLDDKLNDEGVPEDPNDPVLKEIERQGCQNCPNPMLEQIQLLDGRTGEPLYAMTIRGYLGAKNSMVMFGQLPRAGLLDDLLNDAEARLNPAAECPVRYDAEGNPLPSNEQWSPDNCAELLREGAMWSYLTTSPDDFGFDLVAQFNVRDNGTWSTECSGSGESTSCWLVPDERKLEASYWFSETDTTVPWTVMQLLGEVGVRTLGMSYASEAYAGNGLLFAMAQPFVRQQYFGGMTGPESVFALDARALQLPETIGAAGDILGIF